MLLGDSKLIKISNKRVGVIGKDKVFRMWRKKKKHFFKLYNGWAINKPLLKELRDVGIEEIEIHAYDEGKVYRTLLSCFFNHGIEYKNSKGEKDEQIILPINFWKVYPAKKASKKKIKTLLKYL